MKTLWINLTIIVLATCVHAQAPDTIVTRIKWIRQLPAAVRAGWKNCKYVSWKIFAIERHATHADTLYTIDVAQYQSLGPDDADIAEEDLLYFSATGKLLKEERKQ